MIEKMTELVPQLKRLPGARVDLTKFDSGSAKLDVVLGGHLFVMTWFSTYQVFGVDEVKDDEGFLTYYRFTSPDFEPSVEELWRLVRSMPSGHAAPIDLIDGAIESGSASTQVQ